MIEYDDFKFFENKIQILPPGSDDYVCFSEAAYISDVYINALTGKRRVRIQLELEDGTAPYVEMNRKNIIGSLLEELTDVGFSMANEHDMVTTLQDIVMKTEKTADRHYIHDRLGFQRGIDKKIHFYGIESLNEINAQTSHFIDWDDLKPKGTFEDWRDKLKPYVEANPALQLALLLSVSAPITALLQRHGVLTETGIYALVGASSSGKTTSAKVCASVWGNSTGLLLSMNATENYIYDVVSKSCGHAVIFDDASAFPTMDMTSQLYSISSSESRGRCDSNGAAKAKLKFSGSVIYTSEKSLLSQTNMQRGLYARVVQFTNLSWFGSAKEADEVGSIITRYYGHAWKVFMSALLGGKFEKLYEEYLSAVNILTGLFSPQDGLEHRQLKKYAVLLAAVPYITDAWGFQLDVNAILNMLKSTYENNKFLQPAAEVLYDKLINEIIGDKGNYPAKNSNYPNMGGAHGEDSAYNAIPCIWVVNEHFNKLLAKFGYKDISAACKMLFEAGYIVKFPGERFTMKHRVAGQNSYCYAIIKDVSHDDDKPDNKKKLLKVASIKKLSTPSLLE